MVNATIKTIELADGRTITIETGKLAKQADGSVVVRMGDTMLLATVVSAKEAKEEKDFMPLSVDYREKFSAAGRFPGGFLKREGRPRRTMKSSSPAWLTAPCVRYFPKIIMPKPR
jgi:polyribonucleotide nucleotidyltransferase